eukprot:snap_masked-scaffold_54-processed-gene-1.41-mRNA-1 protein AED:1.00 eAED:1.00 QI:0/0/0/0/1/1/2/0/77
MSNKGIEAIVSQSTKHLDLMTTYHIMTWDELVMFQERVPCNTSINTIITVSETAFLGLLEANCQRKYENICQRDFRD